MLPAAPWHHLASSCLGILKLSQIISYHKATWTFLALCLCAYDSPQNLTERLLNVCEAEPFVKGIELSR